MSRLCVMPRGSRSSEAVGCVRLKEFPRDESKCRAVELAWGLLGGDVFTYHSWEWEEGGGGEPADASIKAAVDKGLSGANFDMSENVGES